MIALIGALCFPSFLLAARVIIHPTDGILLDEVIAWIKVIPAMCGTVAAFIHENMCNVEFQFSSANIQNKEDNNKTRILESLATFELLLNTISLVVMSTREKTKINPGGLVM